jgi:hypothetical protein
MSRDDGDHVASAGLRPSVGIVEGSPPRGWRRISDEAAEHGWRMLDEIETPDWRGRMDEFVVALKESESELASEHGSEDATTAIGNASAVAARCAGHGPYVGVRRS